MDTTRFLYDGDRLVMELDGSGNVTRAYVHGPGADEPMVTYGAEGRRFLHADHQGSIIAANDDAGNVAWINSYDPWGVPGAGNQGRFGYTGQAWLPELGMYYYKARIYWPTIGRFMQTDPIGYDDQINLYAYVGNDPVNSSDSSGLGPEIALCGLAGPGAPACATIDLVGSGAAMACAALCKPAIDWLISLVGSSDGGSGDGGRGGDGRSLSRSDNGGPENPSGKVAVPAKEGRYEFPDRAAGNKPYVGQSGDIAGRLRDHVKAGRLSPGTERTTAVPGGRTAREVAEHRRIQQITGGSPARQSDAVSNKRDPIGGKRHGLLSGDD